MVANAFHVDWSREVGPFYIKHYTSNKYLHPLGGSQHPSDNTRVVIHNGYHDACLFSFIPIKDQPGFGLIKHWTSGKFLHPLGGRVHSPDNTAVLIHSGYHYATFWAINSQSKNILSVGGKFFHPNGGSVTPGDDTGVILHGGTHTATQFVPVDGRGDIVNINGAALAGGRWERIFSIINSRGT